jgi:curli biogenesis system outer membrane secretion channel CsgG
MKRLICGTALLALTLAFLAPGPAWAGSQEKPRLGVLRFTNHTSAGWWSASVGEELSDMLASELVSTDAFDVLERKEIDAVLGEQDLGESGRIDAATKAKLGQIKGAEYLIAATVSSYEEGTSGSGAGVRVGGLSLGGKKDRTYIAVDLKVINTTTGAIVDARTIEAESKGSGIGAGVNLRGISVAGDTFKRTPAGKAIRACIIYMSEYLDCSLVQGKNADCMKKWNEMDQKRRQKTKSTIDIQ